MNSKIIADTHAAIDRLVAHLERQATEHVHALDALRAEVDALRTQNAHLRALQAAWEVKVVGTFNGVEVYVDDSLPDGTVVPAKPVREVVRGRWDGHPQIVPPEYADQANEHAPSCRCAVNHVGELWSAYGADDFDPCARNLTEPEAIAWVLDGVLPAR